VRAKRNCLEKRQPELVPEPNDPLYGQQWHLHATPSQPHVHLNAPDAWRQGYYGEGVLVSIVDDVSGRWCFLETFL
jgi:hypothetical protein